MCNPLAERKISACVLLRECSKAQMCLDKLVELKGRLDMYAWHEKQRAGDPNRPFHCHAQLEPRLKGLAGHRIEVTYEDGWTQRFWVVKTRYWMPRYLSTPRRNVYQGSPIYLEDSTTIRSVDYDKHMEQW